MDFFFLDDSVQTTPSRSGMGPLVAVGCIKVSGTVLGDLERAIDYLCIDSYGFPQGQEFKWSPGRGLWMRNNLVGTQRERFFLDILDLLEDADCTVTVVVGDKNYRRATDAPTHEMDVTQMCLERISSQCGANPADGIVISDRMGSPLTVEEKFLSGCLETIQRSAGYVRDDCIAINVVSTSSHFVRLIQAADLVTGCTLAAVGGENVYSPPILAKLKPLYRNDYGRIGGVGVKIHPDFIYVNLYHWILGDTHFLRYPVGHNLPLVNSPYNLDPNVP